MLICRTQPFATIAHSTFAFVVATLLSSAAPAQIVNVDQGPDWTRETRANFYVRDQGSRIMPLAWMRALKQPNGEPFLADSLGRYGYLPLPGRREVDIPVGFTVADFQGSPSIGMTCSACHTRQINVVGTAYRIDGGPSIVDFQSFLRDLDASTTAALASTAAFDAFAEQVLGPRASAPRKATLKLALEDWRLRFNTLVKRSLPRIPWGPSRLDAVSMIFNRLTGLDIGEPKDAYLIPENIRIADAPTRYPFLWNAARQDFTQWPGFAANGNDILGLARNLGEVYGVFAFFHPVKESGFLKLNRDYLKNNSANFDGLGTVEDLIKKIGPPKWPWQLDSALAARGQQIYNLAQDLGGCVECHGIRRGEIRPPNFDTWATPILDVGTDSRECGILTHMVKTGTMEGAKIPGIPGIKDEIVLKETDAAFNVLSVSVLGTIIQHEIGFLDAAVAQEADAAVLPTDLELLREAFRLPPPPSEVEAAVVPGGGSGCKYESRVMQGIWAAAPYLHNGSVPTLTELLKPASERVASFKIGPNYDIETVGLAVEQTQFDYTLETTDCSAVDSGNSRCGHEYGTKLSDGDKRALLEYLKAL